MRFPQGILGLIFVIGGLLFAYNSAPHSGPDTHWGFALTGITCLIIGAKFFGFPQVRDALTAKSSKPDAFE